MWLVLDGNDNLIGFKLRESAEKCVAETGGIFLGKCRLFERYRSKIK